MNPAMNPAMNEVLLTQAQGLATISLNRPEQGNALTDTLLASLHGALDALAAPRALILRAEGPDFSIGSDMAAFAAAMANGEGEDYARRVIGGLNRAILRLAALPCPVLASLQGALSGGALGLALAADLVVMAPDGFIQPRHGRAGLAPHGGWSAMLPGRIGAAQARAVQMLNRRISANEALSMGLAQAISDNPEAQIVDWLAALEPLGPGALASTKTLLRNLPALEAALEAERAAFVAWLALPEAGENMMPIVNRYMGG